MPRVKIAAVLEHLSPDLRRALEMALNEVLEDAVEVDAGIDDALLRAFQRAVAITCSEWVEVPEGTVEGT